MTQFFLDIVRCPVLIYERNDFEVFGVPSLHAASQGEPAVKEKILYGQSFRTNDPGSSTHGSFRGRSYRKRIYKGMKSIIQKTSSMAKFYNAISVTAPNIL